MAGATQYEHLALTAPNEPLPQYETSSKWNPRMPAKLPSLPPVIWKQLGAFLVFFCAGFVPFIAVTRATDRFHGVFQSKEIPCGNTPDEKQSLYFRPENVTAEGWEALFALDSTFGKFSFAEAKTVDVTWDVLVGRGLQLIFWYIGYIVFSDAILRVIERHPATYQTFTDITLQGPSLMSMWTLTKDLFRTRSRRTCALFFFLVLSTTYILTVPVFVGAMTGYVNRAEAWVELEGDNIVPAKDLANTWAIVGVKNSTNGTTPLNECSKDDSIKEIIMDLQSRVYECG
jgi:hypothetical protein